MEIRAIVARLKRGMASRRFRRALAAANTKARELPRVKALDIEEALRKMPAGALISKSWAVEMVADLERQRAEVTGREFIEALSREMERVNP